MWSRIAANSSTPNSSTPSLILMSFDRMGRRVSYTETVGVTTNAHRTFVYDNYLQIADNIGNRYLWDPTESIATRPLVWQYNGGTYFYTHDGNKNVSELVDDSGTVTAHYEYAPFGDVTVAAGPLASDNPFRFSSEYADDALGLIRYSDRHHEPLSGRWTERDRIWERSGPTLYAFCLNNPHLYFDASGQMPVRMIYDEEMSSQILIDLMDWYTYINMKYPIVPPYVSPLSESECKCPKGSSLGIKQNGQNYSKMDNECTIPKYMRFRTGIEKILRSHDANNPSNTRSFLPACKNHDKCYASCGSSKKDCDVKFIKDLSTLCGTVHDSNERKRCVKWAAIYASAVIASGDSFLAGSQSWSLLQKEACEECCCE